jgi:hypothetical protein
MKLRNTFQKVIESNNEAELINEFLQIIDDSILRTKALSRQSSLLNYSMNTANYGKTFIEMILNTNNILRTSINCRIELETIHLQTNEEVTKYMTLILGRLHSMYNDLLMDNFTPLNDESIRNLFHHAHQSFASFIPLFKLITLEVEKNVSATNGNIETYQAVINEKFKEFFVIMKDMIENSTTAYKEELIHAINSAIQFNENFVASINFALTNFQSLMIPIDDARNSQFRES